MHISGNPDPTWPDIRVNVSFTGDNSPAGLSHKRRVEIAEKIAEKMVFVTEEINFHHGLVASVDVVWEEGR